ncbi:MAG: ABC transporter ATP-binding protein [Steroidobacteraceae bacterium]
MNVLEVEGLTKRYGTKPAVEDLGFAVGQGQIFGFLGPNGSGKTTTIGMMFGVIRPTRGNISVFGESNRAALARGRMSGTLEQPNLYPYLTGWDNLAVVAAIKGLDKRLIEPALAAVEMLEPARRVVKSYSLGMKQRLALAGAMLGDPELLILDEPTNGLDPEGMREIRELVVRLSRSGRTIILSTHLLDEVEKICTHVAILQHGRLQRSGAVTDFTGAKVTFRLCAEDTRQLFEAVSQYEFATDVRVTGDAVYLDLIDEAPARLNRHLAARGIYLKELSSQRQTLEEAFLAVTAAKATARAGEEA